MIHLLLMAASAAGGAVSTYSIVAAITSSNLQRSNVIADAGD